MQTLSATRTAVMLLAIVMATAGCGARATGSMGSPTDTSPKTAAPTATSTTSTTIADVAQGGQAAQSAGREVTPPTPTTTLVPAVPEQAVGEIDSMIDGLDTTLAELDQLLNQAAAALAAEEGEIIP